MLVITLMLAVLIPGSVFSENSDNEKDPDRIIYLLKENLDKMASDAVLNRIGEQLYFSLANKDLLYSVAYYQKAIEITQRYDKPLLLSGWYYRLGGVYAGNLFMERALSNYIESYKILIDAGLEKNTGFILIDIGNLYYNLDKMDQASSFNRKATRVFNSVGDVRGLCTAYNNMGLIYRSKAKYDSALYYFDTVFTIRRIHQEFRNDPFCKGQSLAYIASIYHKQKDLMKAISTYRDAARWIEKDTMNDPTYVIRQDLISIIFSIGVCYIEMNEYDLGLPYLRRAETMALYLKQYGLVVETQLFWADALFERSDFTLALQKTREALAAAEKSENLESVDKVKQMLVKIYLKLGYTDEALRMFKDHISMTDSIKRMLTISSSAEINAINASLNYEKEAELLRQKSRSQRMLFMVSVLGLVSILIFVFFILMNKRKNERRLRELSNSTYEGILIHENGVVLDMNEKMLEITGYTSSSLKRFNILSHIPEKYHDIIKGHASSKDNASYFIEVIKKDGSLIPIEIQSRPYEFRGKSVRVAAIRDMTKLNKATALLKASEEKYKFMAERMMDVLWQVDQHLRILYLSPSAYNHLGYTPEEIMGHRLTDYLRISSTKKIIPIIKKYYLGGSPESLVPEYLEIEFMHKDGSYVWSEVQVTPVVMEDSKELFFQGVARNITSKKLLELTLEEQERSIHTLFSNLPGIVYRCKNDRDWTMETISDGCFDLTGYQPEDLIGNKVLSFNDLIDVEYKDYLWETWQLVLKEKGIFEYEYPIHTASGEIKWVWEKGRGVFNSRDELVALEGYITDITNRKNYENSLANKNKELMEANATRDKFFSIIAHDLKNPLHAILGFSELLADEFTSFSEEDRLRFVTNIKEVANNLHKLLQNLLEWARSQTGRIDFQPEQFYLSLIVKDVLGIMNDQANAKNIIIDTEIKPDLSVIADGNMLRTVLRNLVSNAIKFSHPGGYVLISSRRDGNKAWIEVADQGVGMTDQEVDKLFSLSEMFRKDGTMEEKGTGLGLILCKEFIEKNEGTITVESKPGKGSKFSFSLPTEN